MIHRFTVRVYYEDTDFSGVVYHANYLRFLERGRTETLRDAGLDHASLFAAEPPLALAVARMEIDFRRPARMDDLLVVETVVAEVGGASLDHASAPAPGRRPPRRRDRQGRGRVAGAGRAPARRPRGAPARLSTAEGPIPAPPATGPG